MSLRHSLRKAVDRAMATVPGPKPVLYGGRVIMMPAPPWHSCYSRYELATANAMRQHLRRGDTFWDVGAYLGWFTVFASGIVGRNGTVLAIEPGAATFEALRRNVGSIRQVHAIHCGVGNTNGPATFFAQGASPAASFVEGVTAINAHHDPNTNIKAESVEMRSLDSFGGMPNLIKLDVEGYELEALRGAMRILNEVRPVLIVEIHPPQLELSQGSAIEVVKFVQKCGYAIETISEAEPIFTICATPPPR